MPKTALVAVTTTGSEGDTWGSLHGVFQKIPYNNWLLCFCEKGYLDTGMVTEEVLKGSVALKSENSKRINHTLCHLKSLEDQFHTFDDFKKISGISHPSS